MTQRNRKIESRPDEDVDDPYAGIGQSFVASRAAVLHEVTDDHVIMSWDRCLGLVWKRETTVAGMDSYTAVYRELSLRFPTGIYLLTVVEQHAPMPSTEAREAVAVFMRQGAGRIRMSAVVHEGAGFRAAAVRSVVTGFAMLAKVPYPHRVFATVDQAAKWLGTTKYRDVDEEYSVLAVNDARRRAEELISGRTAEVT
ncbi:MAG: hypothetical protein ABW252_21235 [Polyangiales bacterium]